MDSSATSEVESVLSTNRRRLDTSAPSSPPRDDSVEPIDAAFKSIVEEEAKARAANERKTKAAKKAQNAKNRRKKKNELSKEERQRRAKELEGLLARSAAFSDMLRTKTQALGRVGTSLDGETLGDHKLDMATQPKLLTGGEMRDYQLEGLTWMAEICLQGLSGILADEMGLGKTVQTISLIAHTREQNYLGPHLIVAPLSTLSNWMDEFEKWCPDIPVVLFHGDAKQRAKIRKEQLDPNIKNGVPTKKFPVVCTSYEMVLRERATLAKFKWAFIIIDEGHRMKNFESKLFQELENFTSATRMLITGTPLQNNLRELWALLHFLLPGIFKDWEAFEEWFNFDDLQDEEGTEGFIADRENQELIKKIHVILQPLLLRRVKADVAAHLPKKREYILFAPMTKEQTDIYNAINDKKIDTRAYLENKVVERLTAALGVPVKSEAAPAKQADIPIRSSPRKAESKVAPEPKKTNAFSAMMNRARSSSSKVQDVATAVSSKTPSKTPSKASSRASSKRKEAPTSETPQPKSAKSSRQSTPSTTTRGRVTRGRRRYVDSDPDDDDKLSDDEFEAKLANEAEQGSKDDNAIVLSDEEQQRVKLLEHAKKEMSSKKLGNPDMQLRLVCNSPHNFFDPWSYEGSPPVDESIVTSSGKMLMLDRLLPTLFARGHKVLIFSQFKTQLDILQDYCELRKWNACRLDGSVSQESRRDQIKEFNQNPDFKIFLLSTRAGGQGINLASADTVILFDSDWNPQQDLQAQDRCHRIGQTRPVIVYRLATKGTVEEELLLSADAKRRLEKLVIKKGSFKTMGQKVDLQEDLDKETLKSLLLKDGQIFKRSGEHEILSDKDLDVLCDRSDEAYSQAARGTANADGYKVIETTSGGIAIAGEDTA
ncbi:SNF2 super family protein [Colletotrichum higginsianum]|uniref:SNF2 super family protein n=2 Tax=Colletotrichum higginsianum TaxID=80884 RepID=H1V519_COLHI|nr:SNF2 super family protein [Colletotrichum higginsianum IMI 349063]OBR02584.1 SNF2 super family protein [Colletotrichum higginsianum IMI 349063]TID06631.1 Lymphoid-specific helicase [Colletotrichum higginsianum]CCF35321.1 SNF2 super family protein [Colletotrichum higginsianum]